MSRRKRGHGGRRQRGKGPIFEAIKGLGRQALDRGKDLAGRFGRKLVKEGVRALPKALPALARGDLDSLKRQGKGILGRSLRHTIGLKKPKKTNMRRGRTGSHVRVNRPRIGRRSHRALRPR